MARGPVLRRQKRNSDALKPNWIAVWWPRVFGKNVTNIIIFIPRYTCSWVSL